MPSKLVDPTTFATNQAVLRVSRKEYVRYQSPHPVARCFLYASSFLPLRLSAFRLLDGGYQWMRFSEQFKFGDITPAVVLDASTGLVASYTDLDSRLENRFPVIKVFKEKLSLLSHEVRNGDEFAATSLYTRNTESEATGRWSDFSPIVVDCAVRDAHTCAFAKAKIPSSHWTAIRLGISQLPPSIGPGLYDISLPESLRQELLST